MSVKRTFTVTPDRGLTTCYTIPDAVVEIGSMSVTVEDRGIIILVFHSSRGCVAKRSCEPVKEF